MAFTIESKECYCAVATTLLSGNLTNILHINFLRNFATAELLVHRFS